MKSSYDVLGVSVKASQSEIRTAFLKRAKVLHPDRFDKATQPGEWQMANDMLQELNQAYAELNSKGGGSTDASSSETGNTGSYTQNYWHKAGALFIKPDQMKASPFENDNFDQHLAEMEQYVGMCFESEIAIGALNTTGVDPLAAEAGVLFRHILAQNSKLISERIALISRLKYLKDKYPFWKTLWGGYDSLGISPQEYHADQVELGGINPRLNDIGNQIALIQNTFLEKVQSLAIQLVAKYGEAFQA